MEIIVQVEAFRRALAKVSSIINPKSPVEALTRCCLFSNAQGMLVFVGSNSEIEIEYTSEIAVVGLSNLLIDAKKLSDIFNILNAKQMAVLIIEENELKIKSESSDFTLSLVAIEQYPRIKVPDAFSIQFSLPTADFKKMLGRTIHACANQDIRQYLNGLLFDCFGKTLKMVATDGHRLALASHELETEINAENQQRIVPRGAANEILNLINSTSEETVSLSFSEDLLLFQVAGLRIATVLINEKYPNYDRVIPVPSDKRMTLNTKTLMETIRQAQVVNQMSQVVYWKMENNALSCFSKNNQDTANIQIEIESHLSLIEMAFNGAYVIDMCRAIGDEVIHIYLTDNSSSALVLLQNDPGFKFILMPIRV